MQNHPSILRYLFGFLFCSLVGTGAAQETVPTAADSIEVQFSPAPGTYPGAVPVTLYAPGADAIFYTTDGSTPSQRSPHYLGSIDLEETTVLRVAAYRHGKRSPLYGGTYLIREPDTHLPVVSIGITPSLLFHPQRGIFMQGNNAVDTIWNKPGANFWTQREFPAHIEIFEDDGRTVYSSLSGLRLFGGMSRLFPQKSMAIVARQRYGTSRIEHPIFGEDGLKKFKFLVLRNSGSDFGKSHFRDGLMTSLVRDWDLEAQDFRPAHVYLNGDYWGIYNIREKINRYFVTGHHTEVDKDSVDLIEHYLTRKRGRKHHYRQLLRVLERYDLNDSTVWAHVEAQMEVDNFLALQLAQIYFDNRDAGGNIRFWRPQTEEGRWRWILYDTDWGFGLHDAEAYRFNSLAFHTEANGPSWPNPPWSTFMLRRLLQNHGFRRDFVNRFADRLNTSFAPERVHAMIDSLYSIYEPEMYRHLDRWQLSRHNWQAHLARMRAFAKQRPTYVRQHLAARFDTGPEREVRMQTTAGGHILLNGHLRVKQRELRGVYFANYPIRLRAVPRYGYRFVRWAGVPTGVNELARTITLDLTQDRTYRVEAIFEPFEHPLQDEIVINEVCAKNKKTGDWIELHNRTRQPVDLNGWILTDLKREYQLPAVTIGPRDYLIVCRDVQRFRSVFPAAYNVVGGLPFGVNKRQEAIGLYSKEGAVVDSMAYTLAPLDTAFTLSLLLPKLDNSDPENWELRLGDGTPNLPNPYYVTSTVRHEQYDWLRMGLAFGLLLLCLYLLRLKNKKSPPRVI